MPTRDKNMTALSHKLKYLDLLCQNIGVLHCVAAAFAAVVIFNAEDIGINRRNDDLNIFKRRF